MYVNLDFQNYHRQIDESDLLRAVGKVTEVVGLTVEVAGITASVGEICLIHVPGNAHPVQAEVVGFRARHTLVMPLGELGGIAPGCPVVPTRMPHRVIVGSAVLGRVLDGLGQPIDGQGIPLRGQWYKVNNSPPGPLQRRRITEPLETGIKCIDTLLTCGQGQRIGIFSGSGVGKSTLLGMIARHSSADVNVIALVGERGREVLDFIEKDLGPKGLERSVVVAATSDQPALVRIKSALVATTLAEYFRDQGMTVMLMMDSITRFAMAMREVGLAIGEPPATRGYPPSVFAGMARLLERSGTSLTGSITGLYTVLVDGDDMNEPIADAVRGILDGHIVLSRELASRNHFPAIDVLQSVSRLMPELVSESHKNLAAKVRDILATYRESEDLINIGAYKAGSNPRIDEAIRLHGPIESFLRQGIEEVFRLGDSVAALEAILGQGGAGDA